MERDVYRDEHESLPIPIVRGVLHGNKSHSRANRSVISVEGQFDIGRSDVIKAICCGIPDTIPDFRALSCPKQGIDHQ